MVNRAIILGRLGSDPEVRYTQDGSMVCNFRVATSESWGKGEEKKEHTEWHSIVAFKKLAEICGEYLRKGALVFIEGRIQTRSWTDKEGVKRFSTEIVAQTMKMLSPKTGGSGEEWEGGAPDDDEPPF